MMLGIDSDDGIVTIGSPPETLPGIVESVSINSSLIVENAPVQGRSGKTKIVQGWDDADLKIKLILLDEPEPGQTRWELLGRITGIFKKADKDGKPEVFTLGHPMIGAWKTARFLFSSLETSENRTQRKVAVSIEFTEYESHAGVMQDRQGGAQQTPPAKPAAPPVSDQQRRGLGTLEGRFAK